MRLEALAEGTYTQKGCLASQWGHTQTMDTSNAGQGLIPIPIPRQVGTLSLGEARPRKIPYPGDNTIPERKSHTSQYKNLRFKKPYTPNGYQQGVRWVGVNPFSTTANTQWVLLVMVRLHIHSEGSDTNTNTKGSGFLAPGEMIHQRHLVWLGLEASH